MLMNAAFSAQSDSFLLAIYFYLVQFEASVSNRQGGTLFSRCNIVQWAFFWSKMSVKNTLCNLIYPAEMKVFSKLRLFCCNIHLKCHSWERERAGSFSLLTEEYSSCV